MTKELGGKVRGQKPRGVLSLSALPVASSGHPCLSPLLPCPLPILQGVQLGTKSHLVVVLNNKVPLLPSTYLEEEACPTSLPKLKAWTSCSHDNWSSHRSLVPSWG